jgi:hypothetical protein
MNCEYWKDIVARLRTESTWASHVLSTCIGEEGSNLSEALKCVSAEEIIENTIFAYKDWDAYVYCREILLQFNKQKVINIYEQINNPSKKMIVGVSDVLKDFEECTIR